MTAAGAKAKAKTNGASADSFKDQLLSGELLGLDVEELEVEGVGTFEIRSLSRKEVVDLADHDRDGTAGYEAKALSAAMLTPSMTYQDVLQWQKVAPAGLLQVLVERIQFLSGMEEGSRKEARLRFRSKS